MAAEDLEVFGAIDDEHQAVDEGDEQWFRGDRVRGNHVARTFVSVATMAARPCARTA